MHHRIRDGSTSAHFSERNGTSDGETSRVETSDANVGISEQRGTRQHRSGNRTGQRPLMRSPWSKAALPPSDTRSWTSFRQSGRTVKRSGTRARVRGLSPQGEWVTQVDEPNTILKRVCPCSGAMAFCWSKTSSEEGESRMKRSKWRSVNRLQRLWRMRKPNWSRRAGKWGGNSAGLQLFNCFASYVCLLNILIHDVIIWLYLLKCYQIAVGYYCPSHNCKLNYNGLDFQF